MPEMTPAMKASTGPLLVGAGAAIAAISAHWLATQIVPLRYRKKAGVAATAGLAGAVGGLAVWLLLSGRLSA